MSLNRILSVSTGKTTYLDGDRAIKVFGPEYPKAVILSEATNQALMEETGLAVARVLEVSKIDGKWAIASEYIRGTSLEAQMKKEPERAEELLDFFVKQQCCVFREKGPLLTRIKDKVNRKIESSPLEATVRFELHARLEEIPKRHSICHGAFYPKNIIITDTGKPYLLNWAHATRGDPAADIANTWIYFTLQDQSDLAERYLSLICERLSMPHERVRQWVPLVAAALSMDKKSEEQQKLLQMVDVADSTTGV